MARGTFCFLLLSGLCGLSLALPRRYFYFIKSPTTWKQALRYCQSKHTDMATVNDEQDLEELTALGKGWGEFVHVGLQKTWSWSLSENDDHKEGEQSYSAWEQGQPGKGYCTSIGPAGGWSTTACSSAFNFFCYEGWVTDLSRRFVRVNTSLSWPKAQTYCRTHHTELARVRNQQDNAWLTAMAQDTQLWIGMAVWRWFWTDGSETSYVPYVNVPPAYVEGIRSQLWINNPPGIIPGNGKDLRPFFCYSVPQNKFFLRLKLSASSSVNLRDPAVTTSIHQWMKTRLSDKGMQKDTKLKWKTPQLKPQSKPSLYQGQCVR